MLSEGVLHHRELGLSPLSSLYVEQGCVANRVDVLGKVGVWSGKGVQRAGQWT